MRRSKGFTLIEVLVAMAIIAIAFTAILKVTDQITGEVLYLKKKTEAHWVGIDLINQVQTGDIAAATSGQALTGHANLFNKRWDWSVILKPTLNKAIYKINLKLSLQGQSVLNMSAYKTLQISREQSNV